MKFQVIVYIFIKTIESNIKAIKPATLLTYFADHLPMFLHIHIEHPTVINKTNNMDRQEIYFVTL